MHTQQTGGRAGVPFAARWVAAFIACAMLPLPAGATVESLAEMRGRHVVRQQADLSCGAAALATLLTYQHGDPVTEREVARGLVSREEYLADPLLVRRRHGFSLLDLKRYAERRGYRGIGLGGLTMDSLIARAPAIVPISTSGYQHFVVFRGVSGSRVLLADPAFGNRTMLRSSFEAIWLQANGIGHVGFVVERMDGALPPNELGAKSGDFVMLR